MNISCGYVLAGVGSECLQVFFDLEPLPLVPPKGLLPPSFFYRFVSNLRFLIVHGRVDELHVSIAFGNPAACRWQGSIIDFGLDSI